MIDVYVALLLAHLLYDWHWQGETVGVLKAKLDFVLFIHCLTYALVMYTVLVYYGFKQDYGLIAFLFFTHLSVDYWKCRMVAPANRLTDIYLIMDQLLHVALFVPIFYIWK